MSHHYSNITCTFCGKSLGRKYNKWGEHDDDVCDSCESKNSKKNAKFERCNQPKREKCRNCREKTGKRIARDSTEEGLCSRCKDKE